MEQTKIQGFVPENEAAFTEEVASEISTRGAVFIEGAEMKKQPFFTESGFEAFADSWNHLLLDEYMNDNGKYRYRRYSQFHYDQDSNVLELLPHAPYSQPSYINTLNGDIQRVFEPLQDHVVANSFFQGLLKWCGGLFDQIEGQTTPWNIKIHPYRVHASSDEIGQPTPEGVHRDGVTYIFMMMLERKNVVGGETTLYDANKNELGKVTLAEPLDIILADDEKTMHGVTSIEPRVAGEEAYRDVLVVAYTKR